MTAQHLYKHEAGEKRIVASINHDTERGYSIHLPDEDKTLNPIYNDLGGSSMRNVSFEFDGQKFQWDRGRSASWSPNHGYKAVADFLPATFPIGKVGYLEFLESEFHKIAALTTIFVAQRFRHMSGARLVLWRVKDESPEDRRERIIANALAVVKLGAAARP